MFTLAILIGIYSYTIFFLGIAGLLFKNLVLIFTLGYVALSSLYFRNKILNIFYDLKKIIAFKDTLSLTLIILIATQLIINFIGVLGPEISFDALWYHLTLPKIYILNNHIFHIPGNLLYYTDMPKLTEMLYISALMFSNEILAKFIHFAFGVLILIALYKISRMYFSKILSLLVGVIFYANLVVGWESISAYIDLSRTFFELMALWGFLCWIKEKQVKWIILSGLMLGLSISSKLIASESLIIFVVLFMVQGLTGKKKMYLTAKDILVFLFSSLLIPLPWFVFSFLNTKNPVYPFFDKGLDLGTNFIFPNIFNLPKDFLNFFLFSSDPVSPIYLIILPLLVIFFLKAKNEFRVLYIYSLIAVVLWYFMPRIGGGRFILPYLPAFSLLTVYTLNILKNTRIKNFILIVIIFISLTSIGYRALAIKKYIPVILGKETKTEFLTKNLNFSFGDFYDTDGYFRNTIKQNDKVLLFGFHNLYYVNFPFIDSSWVKKGDKFNYIAVQNSELPKRFSNWQQIYYNPITRVKLYSLENKQWVY